MSSKSVKELLDILESSNDTIEKELDDVQMFIKDLEIVPSETKVRSFHIYWAYLNWKEQGNGREKLLERVIFFKRFKKYFKAGRIGKYRYYLVNEDNLSVNRRVHLQLLEDYKKEKEHREWLKRKKQKKET